MHTACTDTLTQTQQNATTRKYIPARIQRTAQQTHMPANPPKVTDTHTQSIDNDDNNQILNQRYSIFNCPATVICSSHKHTRQLNHICNTF